MTTYNKSQIMKTAWNKYNSLKAKGQLSHYDGSAMLQAMMSGKSYSEEDFLITITFGDMLKKAWAEAKEAALAVKRAAAANHPAVSKIDKAIFSLKMADRWSKEDKEIMHRLEKEREALINAIA